MDLQQQFADVTFIGVPEPDDDTASAADFIEGTGSGELTHLHDPTGEVWATFEVTRRQTYILINEDGTASDVDFGDLIPSVEALAS